MSREIKFRLWDASDYNTKGGAWIYFGLKELIEAPNRDVVFSRELPDLEKLCQYTGLKDKNGVEIYEGDVVHWAIEHDDPEIVEINQGNFEVVWLMSGWYLKFPLGVPIPRSSSLFGVLDEDDETLEVIGNIHENLPLLEKETA